MHAVTEYELSDRLQINTSLVWKTDTSTESNLSIEDKSAILCLFLFKWMRKGKMRQIVQTLI